MTKSNLTYAALLVGLVAGILSIRHHLLILPKTRQ